MPEMPLAIGLGCFGASLVSFTSADNLPILIVQHHHVLLDRMLVIEYTSKHTGAACRIRPI